MPRQYSEDETWRRVSPEDRARQFMPFAALKGYADMVLEADCQPEPRRAITPERAAHLSAVLAITRNRDSVRAEFYCEGAYETIAGTITHLDCVMRTIEVEQTIIPFDDLWELELLKGRQRQKPTF